VRAPDGAVAFDVRARLDGRGAWTCARAACVARAVDKGGFARAFEAPIIADADLVGAVRAVLSREVLQALGLLRKAGQLVAGRDEVARAVVDGAAVGGGGAATLVLAADLSANSRAEVEPLLATRANGPPMADIGAAIGRKPTGVLLVRPGPRGGSLLEDLLRAERLAEPVKRA
jgi:predicted RNA-binding protein YlxR (DUF448 family)